MRLSVNCWEKTRRYERGENGWQGRTPRRNKQPGTNTLPVSAPDDALQAKPKHLQGRQDAGRGVPG